MAGCESCNYYIDFMCTRAESTSSSDEIFYCFKDNREKNIKKKVKKAKVPFYIGITYKNIKEFNRKVGKK